MKFIYYTNNTVYSITLLLYLTIIFGMYMQILLGIVQLLLFFTLLFNYKKFSEKMKSHLIIYGMLTGGYLLWFFSGLHLQDSLMLFLITLVPMSIASYFTYIVYQLKQNVL